MKFCFKCGKQLEDSVAFCPGCGEEQPHLTEEIQTAETNESVEIENSDNANTSEITNAYDTNEEQEKENLHKEFIGKTCPYCKTQIEESDEIIVCPACNIAHHKACWEENGGCTTFGCLGKAEGTTICYNCGAELSPEQMFCAKCGTKKAVSETPSSSSFQFEQEQKCCTNCGTPIIEGQSVCSNCGSRLDAQSVINNAIDSYNVATMQKSKSKKGRLIGIIAAVTVIAIVVGVIFSSIRAQKFDEYKDTAKEFSKLCWTCGSNLEDVGNDVKTYWHHYIYSSYSFDYYNGHYIFSIDEAVKYALTDNSSTVDLIETEWIQIKNCYSELKDLPSKNNVEVQEIWNDIKEAYDAMENLYDCVINVSGNYTTYVTYFGNCDEELADALKALDNELD